MFWVISVYFNIRNTLPNSGTFLLGHPVYICKTSNPGLESSDHEVSCASLRRVQTAPHEFWHTWRTQPRKSCVPSRRKHAPPVHTAKRFGVSIAIANIGRTANLTRTLIYFQTNKFISPSSTNSTHSRTWR